MSSIQHRFNVPETSSRTSLDFRSFPRCDISALASTMAARPNNNSNNTNSNMQRMSGGNDGSSMSSNRSTPMKSVADNLLNSWFFRNQSQGSNNGSSAQNSNGKFKADMNIWMPQSMWPLSERRMLSSNMLYLYLFLYVSCLMSIPAKYKRCYPLYLWQTTIMIVIMCVHRDVF